MQYILDAVELGMGKVDVKWLTDRTSNSGTSAQALLYIKLEREEE